MDRNDELKTRIIGFVSGFSITLFIMGGVLVGILSYLGQLSPQIVEQTKVSNHIFVPKPEQRLNMIFALQETSDYAPEVYLLAGFLPDEGKIAITLLPPKSLFFHGNQWVTIDHLFSQGGVSYVAKCLSTAMEIPIEKHGLITTAGVSKLMEQVGYFDYYITEGLDYPHNQRQVVLTPGQHILDGRKLVDIICYPAYDNGEAERSDRGTMLITSMLNHYMSLSQSTAGDGAVKTFLNHCDTNLSIIDYLDRKDATQFLSQQTPLPVTAIYIEGELTPDYQGFILTDTCLDRIKKTYTRE